MSTSEMGRAACSLHLVDVLHKMRSLFGVLTLSTMLLIGVKGHGRLLDPPSRSSMWRANFANPANYDDNQLFCGGVAVQWQQNAGKCGLCGDPWQGPRDNEPGGRYANGIITRKYEVGQVIEIYIQLTANHKGYFEFRLCESNNPFKNITQECLDKHVLLLEETSEKRFMVPDGEYSKQLELKIKARLPADVTCAACVLQWKYNAGNSWGRDPVTEQECVGCGPQEQFYGCADVAIGHDDVQIGIAPKRFPWYFQDPDSEWHYGVAYVSSDTGAISGAVSTLWGHTVSAAALFTLLAVMSTHLHQTVALG